MQFRKVVFLFVFSSLTLHIRGRKKNEGYLFSGNFSQQAPSCGIMHPRCGALYHKMELAVKSYQKKDNLRFFLPLMCKVNIVVK